MSWFFKLTGDEPEPRWYRVLSKSGKPLGLGFSCPKCHFGYSHSAPEQVRHCGGIEAAPKITRFLPLRRIGGDPALPPNVLKIGDWEL